MWKRVVAGTVATVLAAAAPAVAASGQDGPTFTGPFQDEYQGFELIEASGTGCPATGGAPSDTPPGVFVSIDGVGDPSLAVEFDVVEDMVVYTPDTFYPEAQGVYAPLEADGSWSLQIEAEFGSPPRYELEAFCTTLIELTDDGDAVDPESIERARFSSPSFLLVATPLPGPPDPTSTTAASSTTSAPATTTSTAASARPSSTSPRFTG
jgi:hypothetical protein